MATCVRNGTVYVLMTVNKLTVSFIHLFNFEWPIVRARRQNDELQLSAFGKIASSINLKSHFSSISLSNNFNPDRLFEWIGLVRKILLNSKVSTKRLLIFDSVKRDVVARDDKNSNYLNTTWNRELQDATTYIYFINCIPNSPVHQMKAKLVDPVFIILSTLTSCNNKKRLLT